MVVFYVAIGLLFLFTDVASETFSANRTPIGIIFICYGLFRMIITIGKIKKLSQNK